YRLENTVESQVRFIVFQLLLHTCAELGCPTFRKAPQWRGNPMLRHAYAHPNKSVRKFQRVVISDMECERFGRCHNGDVLVSDANRPIRGPAKMSSPKRR